MPATTDPILELSRSMLTEFARKFHADLGVADAYEGDEELLFSLLVEVASAYVAIQAPDATGSRLAAHIGCTVDALAENLECIHADELAR